MRPSRQSANDQVLMSYLLGDLSDEEAERWDEASVADDDIAAQLEQVETDLVDGYVRGELSGATREKFERVYLSSPARRQRVDFAEQLQHHLSQTPMAIAETKPKRTSWLDIFRVPRFAFAAGFAVLLLVGFLLRESLHPGQNQVSSPSIATANPPAVAPAPAPQAPPIPLSVVAFTLAPQMRGVAQIARFSLPQATTDVDFHLELENNDFSRYQVALKSLKTEKPLWQGSELVPVTKGNNRTLSVRIPAQVFTSGMYQLELSGRSAGGRTEFAGSYVFRIASHQGP